MYDFVWLATDSVSLGWLRTPALAAVIAFGAISIVIFVYAGWIRTTSWIREGESIPASRARSSAHAHRQLMSISDSEEGREERERASLESSRVKTSDCGAGATRTVRD